MIPQRVYLKNFLCHGEQIFDFGGHSVWLLHGPNGVGKSAVFDAMIYALFGEHERRHKSGTAVADLVRYGETSMRVEFDFEYRERRYRVWRTRERSGTVRQGVGEFHTASGPPRPIPNVNSVAELKKWVHDTIGLTCEAFTSAVLLRQGAAERLIDAARDARRDLFRSIIDLEPYIRLHRAMADERTGLTRVVRDAEAELRNAPDVSDEQLAAATAALGAAAAAWEQAQVAEAAARERLGHARVWDALITQREAICRQLAEARDRTARSDELGKAVERLRELRQLVPALERVATSRAATATATAAHAQLVEKLNAATNRRDELDGASRQERQKAAAEGERLRTLDGEIAILTGQRDRLTEQIAQADKAADLHCRLAEARARVFDADMDEQLAAAERALTDAQTARDTFQPFEIIHQSRTAYRNATIAARAASEAEVRAAADVVRLQGQADDSRRASERAASRAEEARQAAALADRDQADARKRLERFCSAAGAATCTECGQPVTAAHAAAERPRLEAAVCAADAHAARYRTDADAATEAATFARTAADTRTAERVAAEAAREVAARDRRTAEARAADARTAFDNACDELPPEMVARVVEIEADGFPSEADARDARSLGRQVKSRTTARDVARSRCQERDDTNREIATLEDAIAVVGAPPDVSAARAELAVCGERLTSLGTQRTQAERTQQRAAAAELDFNTRLAAALGEMTRLAGEVGGAEASAAAARANLEDAVGALPPEPLNEDPVALADELQRLEAGNVEREFDALAEDRALQAGRERQRDETEDAIRDRVPEDARRPAAEVEVEVTAAERATRAAEKARDEARRGAEHLSARRTERDALRLRLTDAERDHALYTRLTDLLGAEGIQLHLIRQAERRIVDLANEGLGRVSCGELRLEPPDPDSTEALDLSVRRTGCPDPIPVGNLSGGQRCRVAIALALAVCRFACGETQPLQSLVIDEAFANLDRDGRMAMIDVIRDGGLAGGALQRIIIVSHHEDVAAAFPVGYRLENVAGATVVARF